MIPPRALAVIQARMGSRRLPGKVLATIEGTPSLEILLGRLKQCQRLHSIVVATTRKKQDDIILSFCLRLGIQCTRGDEFDVLSRFVGVLNKFPADYVVRVTADNPLTDPTIIDELVDNHLRNNADYTVAEGIPVGMGAEVISSKTLQFLSETVLDANMREHVTLFIVKNPSLFKVYTVPFSPKSTVKVTVDKHQDLLMIQELIHE